MQHLHLTWGALLRVLDVLSTKKLRIALQAYTWFPSILRTYMAVVFRHMMVLIQGHKCARMRFEISLMILCA